MQSWTYVYQSLKARLVEVLVLWGEYMRFVVCVRTPVCPFEELYSVHNDSKCCPDQKIVLHTCISENLHMLTCFLCVFLSLNNMIILICIIFLHMFKQRWCLFLWLRTMLYQDSLNILGSDPFFFHAFFGSIECSVSFPYF